MSSRSFRNHNPGNLRHGEFARSQGAIGRDEHGMAIFATSAQGFQAMVSLLGGPSYTRLCLSEAIARYAPSSDGNQPLRYAQFVSQQTGLPLDCRLEGLSRPQLAALAWAMAMFEGWQP